MSTLNQERWRLPSASSWQKAEGILERPTPGLPPQVYSSFSVAHGTPYLLQYLEEAMSPDKSTILNPTFDLPLGFSATRDGPSGVHGTEVTAEDSDDS